MGEDKSGAGQKDKIKYIFVRFGEYIGGKLLTLYTGTHIYSVDFN